MHAAPSSGPIILYHKNRTRIERIRGLSHLVPALILLSGVSGLFGGQEPLTPLLALEVLVGAAYVALLVRELRQLRRYGPGHHGRVAWLELAAAGILALEGYHIWHRHHEAALRTGVHRLHVLPWLYWAVAGWYGCMAFGMAQLHQRRHLHLHADGFSGRLHPFGRKFSFAWANVSRVELNGAAGATVFLANGGRQEVSFAQVHNGPAYRDQLVAHAASGRQA